MKGHLQQLPHHDVCMLLTLITEHLTVEHKRLAATQLVLFIVNVATTPFLCHLQSRQGDDALLSPYFFIFLPWSLDAINQSHVVAFYRHQLSECGAA